MFILQRFLGLIVAQSAEYTSFNRKILGLEARSLLKAQVLPVVTNTLLSIWMNINFCFTSTQTTFKPSHNLNPIPIDNKDKFTLFLTELDSIREDPTFRIEVILKWRIQNI
jgi:hypothetical protein